MSWISRIVLIVGICLGALIACEDEEPVDTEASQASGTSGGKAASATTQAAGANAVNSATPYTYSAIGKRDPFRSYLADMAEVGQEKQPVRKTEATEEYEIDQYRLTALITGTSQPKAMVEDPTGRGHVLHIGSRIGRHGGQVTRIANEGIVVMEEYRDPTGKRMRVPIRINLPKSEGEDVAVE